MDFKGKVILVTGAGRGIGAAIAAAFAREGATVAVNYLRNAAAANNTVEACKAAGGDAWAVRADVSVQAEAQAMGMQVLAEAGRIDVVVNNAFRSFVFDPEQRKRFWELDWSDYQEQIDGAVRSAYNVIHAVLPHFRLRAQGSIVNVASDLVARPVVPYHDYTTAKSALVGFSRNLAAELGPLGIRVNCVAPGLVYPTDASRATREDVKEQIAAQSPLRRIATPEDVAGPVLFLASDWSRFMTGQVLYVDGGLVME
ncbi:MAG TPA: SDR family oxidoreductase [Burkholderiaceae bacterium]|nr:SDR family oxidoreductase [Burkholderiaceae bacterium]